MADIDELKFSIILDDNKFKQKMEEVNAAAEKFEKSVKAALAVQNLLDAAQSKGVKSAEQKAQSAEKSAAAAKKEAAAMGEQEKEEEKVYKLVELRRKRKEQSGQLTNDEVQVLKQMESIEKALLNIREQHKGKLAEEFGIMMNEEGMTRQQVGSYQSLVTQMQAATSESAKREAAEKAALTLREQKENAILALKRTLAGVNQELLSAETKINIQKGLSGELTAKEIASLQIAIATENKRNAAQKRADAEKQAAENALIGLRQTLVGINQKILSEEVKQKIAKAEAGQLTSKEISQLNAQIALEKSKTNEMERQRASAASISSQLTRQTSIMKGLTSYVAQYASIFGAATILRNLIRITGEFEAQHVALRAILQDSVAADNIYNQLQVLAVKSPYTFQNLVSYAKQLTAFSIPVNEVYETTKKLADVSAGLGVDMGRIILAYGQVRSAEFLRGQEVRQFTEAGIPILAELAKQFEEIEGHAISVGEVFNRISARQVPFEMVEEAFNRMTSAGGKFYNMQEVLAETVKGKISNLQDAWEIMLSKIGNENSGTIKGIVTMLTGLFANYEKWIGYVSAVVTALGTYTVAMGAVNAITKTANAVQALYNSFQIVRNAQLKLSTILIPTSNAVQKAAIANNMTEAATLAVLNAARKAALGILGMLTSVIVLAIQKQRVMREENEALSRSMDELTRSYRENFVLFSDGWGTLEKTHVQYKDGKKTVKDYKDALNDLYEKFPNFIDENVRQKIAVEDLAGAWDAATQNMKQYYAENASHQAHEILLKGYKEDTNKIVEDLNAQLRTGGQFKQYRQNGLINEGSIQLLDAYVMGLKTEEELTEDLRRLIYLLNSAGETVSTAAEGDFKGPATLNTAGNLIDVARAQYLARTREFNKAVEESDDAIERDFTSTRHRQVREYLMGEGVAEDSDMMMRNGTDDFESWQSWQGRLRKMYKDTGEENQKVIEKMFSHFGLVVSEDGLTPAQSAVSEWIKKNPAPDGVSMDGFEIKPETNVAEFAEKALKQMQDDAKALARLPKEFQKTEGQGWNEYAKMLKDKGDATSAARARGIQYFERMSQEIWEDDVFGSTKELLKKEKQSNKNWAEFRRSKIADLKQRFQDLKELKNAYDQFKGLGFNDKQIGGLLTYYFGGGIPDGGFGNAFESLAKEMDKYSVNDAKDIRNFVAGKDWKENAKSIEEARKATDKFAKSLVEFQAVTKRLGLDGFAAEIDKILVETNAKNQKLSLEWSQKEEELEAAKDGWIAQYRVRNENATIKQAQKAWEDFYKAQKDAAKESVDAQIAYNNKLAQMSVDGKADEWVGTMLKREDISLSDWSDKTPEQIDAIKEKLIALRDNLSELIPEQLKADAESVNVTFEELLKTIEKIINNKIDTTDVEKAKKSLEQMAKGMQKISSYLGSLGESVSSLGGSWESLGGSISSAGNYLSSYADITQKVKSGQMTQNAANISAYMMIGQYLISSTAEIVANFKELREATEAWEMQLQQAGYKLTNLQLDALSYEQNGVFGVENPYSKALAASEQLRASQSKLLELTESISKIKVKVDEKTVVDGMKVAAGAIEGAALGAVAGSIIPGIGTAIGAAAGAVLGVVKGIFAGRKKKDIETTLGSLTGGLIFDPETLELTDEVLSKYEQMDEAGRALVDHWEEIKETMKEAIETFNENIQDVVGDMAADVKDMLIAAFNDGDVYGAVDDLHDYIGDKIQDLLIDIAYSTALQPLFDELEKNMRHSFGLDENGNPLEEIDDEVDYDWTDDLADFNSKLDSSLVLVKKAFDSAKKELEDGGYSWNTGDDEDSEGGTLASGIKSITEDTANLLASYVNAIRADVSYGRLQWERVAVAVEGQSNQYVTLNDYLAQVQSNTYDTAQRCNDILVELRGIITTEDGSPSVRTSPQ